MVIASRNEYERTPGNVVSIHQQRRDGGCGCNWVKDKTRHGDHVIEQLEAAGFEVVDVRAIEAETSGFYERLACVMEERYTSGGSMIADVLSSSPGLEAQLRAVVERSTP